MKKSLIAASAGLLLCLGMSPLQVSAASTGSVLQSAGIAALLESSLSTEEYIQIAQEAQGAVYGYTNLGIADVTSCLNVRREPSVKAELAGQMPADSACEVLEVLEGWAHIQSGGVEGYVSTDYLLTGPEAVLKAKELVQTVVRAEVSGLNIRLEPDTASTVLTQVAEGEELEFLEDQGKWLKVGLDNNEAYVCAEYVTIQEKLKTAVTVTELRYGTGVSDVRVELVEYAKQFLGNPYVWGGTSLTKGADCSGFVLSIFKNYGVTLPHYSGAQADCGTLITFEELQPGDLIFYNNDNGVIGHVAIYIGDSKIIHASSPSTGIKISRYDYRTPAKYVRILKD